MASNQNISHKAGEVAGQAQEKSEGVMSHVGQAASGTAQQAGNILQQTGESVMNMASGAASAVKNTLGMNSPADTNTTSNAPGHPASTATTTTTAQKKL